MKHEVEVLLQKARESLHAAGLLKQEGYLDFAASRAYYAMFYAAEALLLDRGLSYSSHSAVIAAFGKEFAKTKVLDPKFHRCLIDAQDLRNLGDYGIGPGVTADQAQEVLLWAAEFLAAAEAAHQSPRPSP
jgi:uncharacterized protein (UPF0332 family)